MWSQIYTVYSEGTNIQARQDEAPIYNVNIDGQEDFSTSKGL